MKKKVGIWIDHRDAIIVTFTDEGEEIQRIKSDVEKHGRYSASVPGGSPEDQRDRRIEAYLQRYYAEVIVAIRGAAAILLLGPGEAKGELETQVIKEGLGGSIIGVETVDKLTEPQLVAKIRRYYLDYLK